VTASGNFEIAFDAAARQLSHATARNRQDRASPGSGGLASRTERYDKSGVNTDYTLTLALAIDPCTPSTVYAGTNVGVFDIEQGVPTTLRSPSRAENEARVPPRFLQFHTPRTGHCHPTDQPPSGGSLAEIVVRLESVFASRVEYLATS
jgi:hypothetical protein